jgi:hypothetical protein
MGMIAIAELGRIPLASLLFRRHKAVDTVPLAGIVLAGAAFENWTFGFERIVELRLKPVSAARLVVAKAEAKLKDLEEALQTSGGQDPGNEILAAVLPNAALA